MEISEKENYFVPKRSMADINEKISGESPRFLEEEGFYVNKDLNVPKNNLNMLENRLIASGDKRWFNGEGNLQTIPNPAINRSVKPSLRPSKNYDDVYQYKQPTIPHTEFNEIVIIKAHILELHISKIKFIHHSLFSLEHVLKAKLSDCYEKYQDYVKSNKLQKLRNHLEALRHVRKNAERIKQESGDWSDENMKKYAEDIKDLRSRYFDESKQYRNILKSTISTWRSIKKLRETQKYSCTNIKLLIRKDRIDIEQEKLSLDEFFEQTFKEVLEEEVMLLNKVKDQEKNLVGTNGNKVDDGSVSGETSTVHVDEDRIRRELRNIFDDCLKPSDEPNLKLFLTDENEVTETTEDQKENARRQAVLATKFSVKIQCNKIDVCKSKQFQLDDDFELQISESYAIQLTAIPKHLTVEIIEHPGRGLLKKLICQIDLPLPMLGGCQYTMMSSHDDYNMSVGKFEKSDIVHYNKHTAVGSGIKLDTLLPDLPNFFETSDGGIILNTNGFLEYSMKWEGDTNDMVCNSVVTDEVLDDVIDKFGAVNYGKFREWIDISVPDPQDPKNCVLYEYLQLKDRLNLDRDQSYFRLSPYLQPLTFCDISEIENNLRYQMLQLRDKHEIEFDGLTVPNRVKEISINLFNDYKRRISAEQVQGGGDENELFLDEEDDFLQRKSAGRKFLKSVYTRIFHKCKSFENNLDYESVVNEKFLSYFEVAIKTIVSNFLNWFKWQPGLPQPLPKISKSQPAQIQNLIEQTTICIHLISAHCMPKRVDNTFRKYGDNGENHTRPFIEVSFGDFVCRSSTNAVSNDRIAWNEELSLPFAMIHMDYLNPNAQNGNITINVFDENAADSNIVNWLGDVKVPFSALCSSHMKGLFKIKLPEVLFGYETEHDKYVSKSPRTITDSGVLKNSRETYLEMELSISRSVPILSPNMHDLPSNETPYLKEHILKWNEVYNASYPNRKFNVLVIDTSGRTNCLTRYFKPLDVPQVGGEDIEMTADQYAKYVSKIPFTDSNQFYQNIWLTTHQMFSYGIGSINDHAVALTCFLLSLKLDVYLLLGYGIPHGSTSYILVQEFNRDGTDATSSIYDVSTSEKYGLNDPFCPLQKIYCVVNSDNVWANVQRTDSLVTTRLDFSRRSDWLPLFDSAIEAPANLINKNIKFIQMDIEELELRLERKLRKKFAKLRQLERTVWNHSVSNSVKNLLKLFDSNLMSARNQSELINDIRNSVSSSEINGYIVNLRNFTTFSDTLKFIKSTNIQNQENGITNFALAVVMQPFVGQVVSLWIFLAVILSK